MVFDPYWFLELGWQLNVVCKAKYLDYYKGSINGGGINTHTKQTFLCSSISGNVFFSLKLKKVVRKREATEYLPHAFF